MMEQSSDTYAKVTLSSLEEQGERWTGMRAEVFDDAVRDTRPLRGYDIARHLSKQRGSRVAPNSVYRILDIFVRGNLANRIESANAFLVNSHPGCRHDCIFLICDDCGAADHIDDDRVTGALREAGRDAGYSDVRPVIELRGLCAECSS